MRVGFEEKYLQAHDCGQSQVVIPIEAEVCRAQKSPEERELVGDSGASMHMMSKKNLSSEGLDTLRRSRKPGVVLTANGEVYTNEDAHVFVCVFFKKKIFVTVQLLAETLAVQALGKLCEDYGYSFEWGQRSKTTVVQVTDDNCMQNG